MDGDRIKSLLSRIDTALQRIENSSHTHQPSFLADGDLAEKHEKLREAAALTLRQLDALISEQSQ